MSNCINFHNLTKFLKGQIVVEESEAAHPATSKQKVTYSNKNKTCCGEETGNIQSKDNS